MIKLVIFDFDDTLCMTEAGCFEMENAIAKQLGLPEVDRDKHRQTWGIPLQKALPKRFPGVNVDLFMGKLENAVPRFAGEGIIDAVPLKNLQMLDDLKRAGISAAVLTSRMKFECEHLLAPDGPLDGRIERFYFKEAYQGFKPDPIVFSGVLKDFDVLPCEAAYIGDSPADAVCAKGAGLYFIACLESGLRTVKSFKPQEVDDVVHDLLETIDSIRRIESKEKSV